MRGRVFSKRDEVRFDGLSCDESVVVRRLEQRTGGNGGDDLQATEGLLRSSNSSVVITMEPFMVITSNPGSPSPLLIQAVRGASNEKKKGKLGYINWLTDIGCRQPVPEWQGSRKELLRYPLQDQR
jgi:hypothetical protein